MFGTPLVRFAAVIPACFGRNKPTARPQGCVRLAQIAAHVTVGLWCRWDGVPASKKGIRCTPVVRVQLSSKQWALEVPSWRRYHWRCANNHDDLMHWHTLSQRARCETLCSLLCRSKTKRPCDHWLRRWRQRGRCLVSSAFHNCRNLQ